MKRGAEVAVSPTAEPTQHIQSVMCLLQMCSSAWLVLHMHGTYIYIIIYICVCVLAYVPRGVYIVLYCIVLLV